MYFTGYVNHSDDNIKPLFIQLQKLHGPWKFWKIKIYAFMLKQKRNDILNKYSEVWERIIELTGKRFNVEVIYNIKYI